MTVLTFSSPDVAVVAEMDFSGTPVAMVSTAPGAKLNVSTAAFVSSNTYSTLDLAYAAAVAIEPDFEGYLIYGNLELIPENVSPSTLRPEVGGSVSLSAIHTVNQTGATTYEYQWYKNDIIINGATSGTITESNFTAAMRGNYKCVVVATNSTKGTSGTVDVNIAVLEPLPYLDASDAIGGTDPYGSINTGRGDYSGGNNPLDLNFSFITLINTTYTQSQLELYVPETNTTIPYVTNLPAPYHFDSNGACFTGTDDFRMEIRLAANNTVLGEVIVPGPQSTNDEIYFWAP